MDNLFISEHPATITWTAWTTPQQTDPVTIRRTFDGMIYTTGSYRYGTHAGHIHIAYTPGDDHVLISDARRANDNNKLETATLPAALIATIHNNPAAVSAINTDPHGPAVYYLPAARRAVFSTNNGTASLPADIIAHVIDKLTEADTRAANGELA